MPTKLGKRVTLIVRLSPPSLNGKKGKLVG